MMSSHSFDIVTCNGGAVGMTKNPADLRRWMVSGPDMSKAV